jgi:hypothetical protein
VSEISTHQTSMGGPGYVHPRSDKYRDNFDEIFRKDKCEDCSCMEECKGDD